LNEERKMPDEIFTVKENRENFLRKIEIGRMFSKLV
jgi:hypothetical protein